MAKAITVNRYEDYSDRGAVVHHSLKESVEVDVTKIIVGKPLPGLPDSIVRHYDFTLLELERDGKIFCITPGKEEKIGYSGLGGQMGVSQDMVTTVKYAIEKPLYLGGFQLEDRVRQELRGPIGDGEVWLPNGDHFKGYFHLNYASINGPAYAAEGRYTFANGDYIEHAWIVTDSELEHFLLTGLYRVCTDFGFNYCIAMFKGGCRYGVELQMPSRSCNRYVAQHWYDNVVKFGGPNEVVDHEIDESEGDDCMRLTLTLHDSAGDYIVRQCGGSWFENDYGKRIYKPKVSISVTFPGGDVVDDDFDKALIMLQNDDKD